MEKSLAADARLIMQAAACRCTRPFPHWLLREEHTMAEPRHSRFSSLGTHQSAWARLGATLLACVVLILGTLAVASPAQASGSSFLGLTLIDDGADAAQPQSDDDEEGDDNEGNNDDECDDEADDNQGHNDDNDDDDDEDDDDEDDDDCEDEDDDDLAA